jgi:hypothetical protein
MSSHAEAGQFSATQNGGGSEEQRRVDAIVAEAKRGIWRPQYQPNMTPSSSPSMPPKLVDQRLSEEIEYVQRLLELMGDQLAGDPVILQRHMRTMQSFDLAGQILGHIAKIIVAEDKPGAIDGIGMHELRARLKRQGL